MENIIETPLCELAYKYGTDKCPRIKHFYTPVYYDLFKDRRDSIKKVLELGIGYYATMRHVEIVYDKHLKRHYHKGASLKMWRDFFPNATVYGGDIAEEALFEDNRIVTFLFDEKKEKDLENVVKKVGSDVNIVIDDASHECKDQIFACIHLMPLLNKDVTYVIEDVGYTRTIAKALKDYDVVIPKLHNRVDFRGKLMIVRHKI